MKVVDAFLFSDELDMLECRLTELDSCVDAFILAESPETFQGAPKPLWYQEHKERFAPWSDRIIHVIADLASADVNTWARENLQRNAMAAAISTFDGFDVFCLSDVDEIPTRTAIDSLRTTRAEYVTCEQAMHCFSLDLMSNTLWKGTASCRVRSMKGKDPWVFRYARTNFPTLSDAGWHLSWLGGDDAVVRKATSFAHEELTAEICADPGRYLRELVHVDGTPLHEAPSGYRFPQWIEDGHAPDSWRRPR